MIIETAIGGIAFTGVAWFLIRFLTRLVMSFKNTMDNHITHNTEAVVMLKGTIEQNTRVLDLVLTKLLDDRENH
jgi:hypothetical protein